MEAETPGAWFSEQAATFGDRLAAAREAAGLTEEEVALGLGVRTRTVRQWENDMAEPRANRMQMLSGLLGVSLMWLMTGRGDGVPPPGAEPPAAPTDDLARELGAVRAQLGTLLAEIDRIERHLRQRGRDAA